MRSKYKTGDVCMLDVDNTYYKQDDKGYNNVIISKCIGRKKLFGEIWYKVIGIDHEGASSDPFEVPEGVLTSSNKIIIRYPSNIPIVNKSEIDALKYVVVMMKNEIPEMTMRRLVALKDKLDFYNNAGIVREEIV